MKTLKNKNFLLLLAGGLVVLLAFVILDTKKVENSQNSEQQYQTKPDQDVAITEGEETKNWSIYTNKELDFSIKYPKDVIIWKDTPEWVIFTPKKYSETDYFPTVALQIIDRGNSENPEDAQTSETSGVNGQGKVENRKVKLNNAVGVQVMLNSKPTQRYYLNDSQGTGPVVVLFLGNDIQYLNPDISQLEQMITTFRFER